MLILLLPFIVFISTCCFVEYLKFKTSFSRFFVQDVVMSKEDYDDSIRLSIRNLFLSSVWLQIIYPFLENRFILNNYSGILSEFLKLILILLISDTMFYWTHRFMHLKLIYKYVHKKHHQHINPVTWSAFYFHINELIITWLFVFLLPVLLVPVYYITFVIYVVFLLGSLIKSHSNINIYNKYSSEHHEIHHKTFKWNFGSDLGLWDKICNTQYKQIK